MMNETVNGGKGKGIVVDISYFADWVHPND